MNTVLESSLLENVMLLKPLERIRLADAIYQSLDIPDNTVDQIWYDEAERRLAAYKKGKRVGIPAEIVLGPRE